MKGASLGIKLIILADVDEHALVATVDLLRSQDAEAIGVRTYVANPVQVDALAQATLDACGGVHLLFNTAGVGAGGFVWENSANDYWQWVFGVNVIGVANELRLLVPVILKQG